MIRTMTGVIALFAMTCAVTLPAAASSDPAMDADIHKIELRWEEIKFKEIGAPDQFDHIDALATQAGEVAKKYPGHVEPLIWQGIVTSEEAGMASMLKAMGYAKKAKSILEKADAMDPNALDAGAPTSLGVLYYRVPGFPIGFGDKDKARQLLEQAVAAAPQGMDANYFYADFLMEQKEYPAALKVLEHALTLPAQPDRPLWDANRRAVIKELIAKAKSKL